MFLHQSLAVIALCPILLDCSLVTAKVYVTRGEYCCNLANDVAIDAVCLVAMSAKHHICGSAQILLIAMTERATKVWICSQYGNRVAGNI